MGQEEERNNNTEGEQQQPVQEQGEPQEQDQRGCWQKTTDWVTGPLYNLWDWNIFWWECLGTALFAHGIAASDGNDAFVTLSLFAGIMLVAPFTGGHLNPAVTFGFFIKNGINGQGWEVRDLLCRSAGQLLGACIGGATAFSLLGMSAAPNIPSEDWRMLGGYFTGEAFGTLTFVLTILIMTDKSTQLVNENKPANQRGDSLTVFATIALALHFSRAFTYKTGGGLNPGIAVGMQIWLAIDEATWEPLIHSWLFILGPFLGAAIASAYYTYFHMAATNGTGCFAEKQVEQQPEEQQQQDPEAAK